MTHLQLVCQRIRENARSDRKGRKQQGERGSETHGRYLQLLYGVGGGR